MYPFADGMQELDVDGRSATVVPVVFVLCVAVNAFCAVPGRELKGGPMGDAGYDRAGVEGEDGCVDVDVPARGLVEEYFGEGQGREERWR